MTIRKLLIYSVMALASTTAMAQKIVFSSNNVNTGATLWKKPVTATFKFHNRERTPLVVTNVVPMCGCMVTTWTKEPIAQGKEGEIQVTYDAMQLGHFDKMIDVYTNEGDKPVTLRLKGIVTNGDVKDITENYPYRVGDILLSTNNIEFPDASKGDTVFARIDIMNDSKQVYTPTLMHLPPYITATARPAMLARGRRGTIDLMLDSRKLVNLGLTQTSIYLAEYAGDKVSPDNEIAVTAVLLPEVDENLPEIIRPAFKVSTTELNLGSVGKKKSLKGKVRISNTGRGVLRLSAIEVFNQALTVQLPKREVLAGQSVDMTVKLDMTLLSRFKTQPRVLLISNDPKHQKETITVTFTE
ncbi:MAG: DUF1573 domain-containing protein [Bacteroidaceae bacterium]|nr:DUF1573 domain-containing protein [Bacteroidaceae bacterium]